MESERAQGPDDLVLRQLGLRLLIDYEAASGDVTRRQITLLRVAMRRQADGALEGTHILAYCHLRRGERLFRIDRLRALFDPETGEVIDDLTQWLTARIARVAPAPTQRQATHSPPSARPPVSRPTQELPPLRTTPPASGLQAFFWFAAAIAALFVAGAVVSGAWRPAQPPERPPEAAPAQATQPPPDPCARDTGRPPICGAARVERGSF